MPATSEILIDRNGDGFYDDARVRFLVNPSDPSETFWARLIDLGACLGLESQALPLPLFVRTDDAGRDPVDSEVLYSIQSIDDIAAIESPFDGLPVQSSSVVVENELPRSADLLDIFTPQGMLLDLDGDLLPDSTTIGFDLPEDLPACIGVALANLATRIGLESGGISLPLVGDAGRILRVRVNHSPAVLRSEGDGWTAQGDPDSLSALIEALSQTWPHYGFPDTAGARYSVDVLGRVLASHSRPEDEPSSIQWELQWSAEPETDRILKALDRDLISRLMPGNEVEVTIFACEPLPVRKKIERSIEQNFSERGIEAASVTVLSAFKSGLSWLCEVVLPDLVTRDVARLEIEYRRFAPAGPPPHLDLSIRWLQELFPGNEILARELGIPLDAITIAESTSEDGPVYLARAFDSDGAQLGAWECDLLSYAMPFLPNSGRSEQVQVTTGGFIASVDGLERRVPIDTDLDRFWRFWQGEVLPRVLQDIREDGGFAADRQPFFGALEAEVWLSSPNSRLGVREENDSAAEALHEDIYFNTLDTIEVVGQDESGERTTAPGPVIPIVHVAPGIAPHAVVRLRSPLPRGLPSPDLSITELRMADHDIVPVIDVEDDGALSNLTCGALRSIEGPATAIPALLRTDDVEILTHLPLPRMLRAKDAAGEPPPMDVNLHGDAVASLSATLASQDVVFAWVEDHSYQGRDIIGLALREELRGRVWSPSKLSQLKPTALIVARHHANEISSTNAALRLAHLWATDPEWEGLRKALNVVILPYENADGAALHARLSAASGAATWKHHPARYNALGHEFGEDFHNRQAQWGEARARPAIWRRWLPDVIVDNHGVPSHEWVQPFAGFGSPPRFSVSYWIPQALMYGIVRYVDDPDFPDHIAAALALREAVSDVVRDSDIGDLNRSIGESYRFWGQSRDPDSFPGDVHKDMLWHMSASPVDAEGRGFNVRYPRTTVLSWVTEVNDETATGEHLARVARAHLLANRAMLDLMAAAGGSPYHRVLNINGRTALQYKRDRPLKLG